MTTARPHRYRRRLRTTAVALAALIAGLAAVASGAAGSSATLERGGLNEFDQLSLANGTAKLSRHDPFRGHASARFTYSGGGANGYARGVFEPSWKPGERVRYGAAFRLPHGFYRDMQGQVALMRWDNWPTFESSGDAGGIVIYGSDHRARLMRSHYGGEQVPLGRSFRLPEGRWFRLIVRQRLAQSRARSRVVLNGRRVASSRAANSYGRPVNRVRFGVVAIGAGMQRNPLSVSVDEAFARERRGRR